jgi:hypothetical protein
MARYTGPATRISRRLKVDLVGGDQAFERRPYPPGQHGRTRIKESEYLLARPVRSCCSCWSAGWTTSSTGPGSPAPGGRPASWSATATSSSTAAR